ncbi:hypothetical protein OSB04_022946 [Centaurea solstitialis]|uniref:BSD domain-containing protein n=1 Tax=Centaurea solstitialis TaxID=347529 RepID=A0AA38SI56_9ASTR|nr:hypothetical protein OSB04_022946 [Centaurea solstitialis]
MNFFKSMLSDDPEPENMADSSDRSTNPPPNHPEPEEEEFTNLNLNLTPSGEVSGGSGGGGGNSGGGGLWSFGDLVKTITTRSETVLETYRRDLKEFGSGLRKESDLFREVASRAVKELPSSIEVAGASAIDGVLKSTAEIISQGKEALLLEPSSDDVNVNDSESESVQNHSSRGYSRFDSQLNAIQTDSRTFCLDPEDLDDYSRWKLEFVLSDKEGEIEKLIGDSNNGAMEGIYRKVVPNEVDDGSFWCRYFYRVHKLKQQEDMRANFVRRSLTADDEEELSWDVDEEDEVEEGKEEPSRVKSKVELERKSEMSDDRVKLSEVDLGEKSETGDDQVKSEADLGQKSETSDDQKVESERKSDEDLDVSKNGVNEDVEKENNNADDLKPSSSVNLSDEKVESVRKTDENSDIEWDEIEDLGEHDEKKVSQGGDDDDNKTPKNGGLVKPLNDGGEDDDEDLSWGEIEDDDESVKGGKK